MAKRHRKKRPSWLLPLALIGGVATVAVLSSERDIQPRNTREAIVRHAEMSAERYVVLFSRFPEATQEDILGRTERRLYDTNIGRVAQELYTLGAPERENPMLRETFSFYDKPNKEIQRPILSNEQLARAYLASTPPPLLRAHEIVHYFQDEGDYRPELPPEEALIREVHAHMTFSPFVDAADLYGGLAANEEYFVAIRDVSMGEFNQLFYDTLCLLGTHSVMDATRFVARNGTSLVDFNAATASFCSDDAHARGKARQYGLLNEWTSVKRAMVQDIEAAR